MTAAPHNRTDAERFEAYFAVADEIYESLRARVPQDRPTTGLASLTLADLDDDYISQARKAAGDLSLPWPPYLPEAEEYALTYARRLSEIRNGR